MKHYVAPTVERIDLITQDHVMEGAGSGGSVGGYGGTGTGRPNI